MANWLTRLFNPGPETLTQAEAKLEKYWTFGGGSGWFAGSAQVPPWTGSMANAGAIVTLGTAAGIPAVAAAIRLLAETTGMVPLLIYSGEPPQRDKARDSWQWYRLHERPNEDQSAFDFFQDIETSIESSGDAFVWKAKARPIVRDEADIQLFVMNPSTIEVKRENGRKVFKVYDSGGSNKTYDSSSILHVRGWTLGPGADRGTSPIALHRDALGAMLARQQYEDRFFTNSARPSVAIQVPGQMTQEKADLMVERFIQQHTGGNAYKPAVLYNGATLQPFSISQEDAQFIETMQFSIDEVARIFHITAMGMLMAAVSGAGSSTTADDFERFLKVDLSPRLRRIEMVFRNDEDLFGRTDLFPEFLSDAVLRPAITQRFAAYKDAIQGGWMVPDEIRERENLPNLPDGVGQIPQITPVGGAPNPPQGGQGG